MGGPLSELPPLFLQACIFPLKLRGKKNPCPPPSLLEAAALPVLPVAVLADAQGLATILHFLSLNKWR